MGGRARLRNAAATAQRLRASAEQHFPVLTELTARLLSTNLLDAATRLAAQAFLTAVPLLFAVAAFAPASMRTQLAESLRTVFGLTGPANQEITELLGSPTGKDLRQTTGIIGLLMALISATSFSRAMVRVCERAWLLPKAGARIVAWRWVIWILAVLLVIFFQGPLREGFGVGIWLGLPVTFVISVLVWLWTQHLLLAGRVPWLPLLPGAVLAAAGSTALWITARLYIPTALNKALNQYGSSAWC
ncbi:ribonuclease BN [Streptacidiphilus monticola]